MYEKINQRKKTIRREKEKIKKRNIFVTPKTRTDKRRIPSNIKLKTGQWPLLITASWRGQSDVVKTLLSNGAKPDTPNKDSWTPLMYAASRNNLPMLKLLLKLGAHPDNKNRLGWTSLMMATQSGNVLAVSTLIRYGADVNKKSSDRRSALFIAKENKNNRVADVLKKAGAKKLQAPVPSGKREKKRTKS